MSGWLQRTTGVGLGTIRVVLDATQVSGVGPLVGHVKLRLAEPLECTGLLIRLRATQRVLTTHIQTTRSAGVTRRNPTLSQTNRVVYKAEHPLDGTRLYQVDERVPFSLALPGKIESKPDFGDSPLGEFASVVDSVRHPMRGEIEWVAIAVLKRPMALNLRAKASFVVS